MTPVVISIGGQILANWTAMTLQRKKDEARAEALLLGLWYVRRLQKQGHEPEVSGAA